jgi:hypothetical protein
MFTIALKGKENIRDKRRISLLFIQLYFQKNKPNIPKIVA